MNEAVARGELVEHQQEPTAGSLALGERLREPARDLVEDESHERRVREMSDGGATR
jgi:hypothetical protein